MEAEPPAADAMVHRFVHLGSELVWVRRNLGGSGIFSGAPTKHEIVHADGLVETRVLWCGLKVIDCNVSDCAP